MGCLAGDDFACLAVPYDLLAAAVPLLPATYGDSVARRALVRYDPDDDADFPTIPQGWSPEFTPLDKTQTSNQEKMMHEPLLRHKLAPAEYETITKEIVFPAPVHTNYWNNIPEYLIARCPLCDATYTGQLDTYSLEYWTRPEHGESVFNELAQTIGCDHFVRTHEFINLNGLLPTELRRQKSFGGEVPYVHSFWLPDDVKSYGVMHALPICRPEGKQFVPRYIVYIITYYSEDPEEMLNRRWTAARSWSTLLTPDRFANQEEIFDLRWWVEKGKLQWLDPRNPELPLRTGPAMAFPYTNIKGSKEQRIFYPEEGLFRS